MSKPTIFLSATFATILVAGCVESDIQPQSGRNQTIPSVPAIPQPTTEKDSLGDESEQKIYRLKEGPGKLESAQKRQRSPQQGFMTRDASAPHVNIASQLAPLRHPAEPLDRENYLHYDTNPIKVASETPVSTFSIDVDTGSYSNIRRMLNEGRLPVQDAVRVEEMINYFNYQYATPANLHTPFRVTTEMGPTPWNGKTRLLHIGIKGYEVPQSEIPAANLVFLIDVSGSMNSPNKLGLLKKGMQLLVKQLRPEDRVSMVVYAGASGVVLEPTPGDQSFRITHALEQLSAGGSTNGAAGIRLAYQVAESAFIKDGVNRILLATDGDFNVGTTSHEQLMELIEQKRKSGIGFSTLGFGSGNYNDHLAEQLADKGNGSYAYIDTLNEANKVLVKQLSSTLLTIAKDVKIQVEFNPDVVSEYRLIGYENRMLKREDFNNDRIDAGDIGAGHTVTALYEVTLKGSGGERIDSLRYGSKGGRGKAYANELAMLRVRYKQPQSDTSRLIETPLYRNAISSNIDSTTDRYRFAAAVAAFGQQLRGGEYLDSFGYANVLQLARSARSDDPDGYRGEFIQLVELSRSLDNHVQ